MTDYIALRSQLRSICDGVDAPVTLLANASALIADAMDTVNWVGFYVMRGGELILGPFQGHPACVRIAVGHGVCGTAVQRGETLRVEDVHVFPGHIACDAASRSEIVVPLRVGGEIVGVLDIDSPVEGRFSPEDQTGLENVVDALCEALENCETRVDGRLFRENT